MPRPDPQVVVAALERVIGVGHRLGMAPEVQPLAAFRERFHTEKPTLKLLQSAVKNASDRAYLALRSRVFSDGLREPWPGQEELAEEFNEAFRSLNDVIYPPRFIDHYTSAEGWPGSEEIEEHSIRYLGSPENLPLIFERAVDVVKRYRDAILSKDWGAAYALASPELKEWMTLSHFIHEQERAAEQFGGAAVRFQFYGFNWIFPDQEARNNAEVGRIIWPRYVPKDCRRAMVYGFWIRNEAGGTGSPGNLWITEHEDGYRIARFSYGE
ncbi:MAG: hypothetical protein ACK47B_16295 [Armatimonadota bacterium]